MKKYLFLLLGLIIIGCSGNNQKSDAFGNFEADEVLVSAEGAGRISNLILNEGDFVKQGELIAVIDTAQLEFQKRQVTASMTAIASRRQNISVQLDVLNERKRNLLREKKRLDNLIKDGATTQKQIDDINGEIEVIDRNITATRTGLETSNNAVTNEVKPQKEQMNIIEDKISKSKIVAPIDGTILTKYAENGEFAVMGKPILKLADLRNIYLKAYISGSQISEIKIGQEVDVLVDKGKDKYYHFKGKIAWISSKAEFTPKIIQTKEERVNLVYAFKVIVANDGRIKIGMPGEIKFK